MRFCIDYRRLNTVTVRDSYPLPRMDECINSLRDASVFSTLDCNSGFWQITVSPEDKEKTILTSHEGLFWFFRMPFGLKNAPATFKRFVDITLAGLTWKVFLVYLDGIIVYSRSREDRIQHLDAVLHRDFGAVLSSAQSYSSRRPPIVRIELRVSNSQPSPRRSGTYSVLETSLRYLTGSRPPRHTPNELTGTRRIQ
jgi:hypothetical protein